MRFLRTAIKSAMVRILEGHGYHVLRKHYYLPIPDETDLGSSYWDRTMDVPGVDLNDAAALRLIDEVFPPHLAEFRQRFPLQKADARGGFHVLNGSYMAVDAHVYYSLIRHHQPKRIIEIGAGNSTVLASEAIRQNVAQGGKPPIYTVIDPYPPADLKARAEHVTELVSDKVQKVPLDRFRELGSGDMLFIDSSHVLREGGDVQYEFLQVLPRLARGVLVHVHDVSLPKPYPRTYFENQLYWNEQYLLQAFLAFNQRFEVLWPGNHMLLKYPERMAAAFPEIAAMRAEYPSSEPTAFWMRVRA